MKDEEKGQMIHCEDVRRRLHERIAKAGPVDLIELQDAIDFLQKAASEATAEAGACEEKRQGHPMFYEILAGLADLHSRKNHDYADGGSPLGNFERRAAFYAMYPGLDLSDPTVVALVDSMKQLDAAMWCLSNKHTLLVEGISDRLKDVAVYAVIGVVLEAEKEARSEERGGHAVKTEEEKGWEKLN